MYTHNNLCVGEIYEYMMVFELFLLLLNATSRVERNSPRQQQRARICFCCCCFCCVAKKCQSDAPGSIYTHLTHTHTLRRRSPRLQTCWLAISHNFAAPLVSCDADAQLCYDQSCYVEICPTQIYTSVYTQQHSVVPKYIHSRAYIVQRTYTRTCYVHLWGQWEMYHLARAISR